MTTSQSIVWLHLSDLHLCEPKTGWDAHRVLDPLIDDLKKMEADHGLQPDLIFFTGDAAFGSVTDSTLSEQYQDVEQFFTNVRQAFKQEIPKENLFLVPGNHDVDRGEVLENQNVWLEEKADVDNITKLIHGGKKDWKQYMERLSLYQQFLEDYGYNHLLADKVRLIYAEVREIQCLKIGVGGFNSAWTCGRDIKSKLWLGANWQNGTIVKNLKEARVDLKISLIHHPPGWFVEQEDNLIHSQMERDFDFFLHGHEHQGWVRNINNKVVQIAGAACYEGSGEENGYNFVRLNLETGDMEIWLRRFDGQGGGWIPRVIAGKTDNHGLWRIPSLSCLEKFKPSKSNPVNFSGVPANYLKTLETDNQNKIWPNSAMKPIRLFYSYAHEDERFREKLVEHLSNLKRQGLISEWHDRKITAGKSWANEIDENLEKADVVLLLISSKFIASDYCHEVEMKRAMERHNQGLAIVVPILLKTTDYKGCLFADVQGLPKDFKPIEKWQYKDDAYVDIVNGLRKLIEEMQKNQENTISYPPNIDISPSSTTQVDSVFLGKVRDEIKHIFSVNSPSVAMVRDELLKEQPANSKPEEIFVPASNSIDLEMTIRLWRKTIKNCLESRKDLGQGIRECAHHVLGWLVLLVVKEAELNKHSRQVHDFYNTTEIIVPITTTAGTGIFVARLFEKPARLQLTGNKVHCSGWIDPGKLERGLFPDDRLRDIEREIYQQVMFDLPPNTGDWLAELRTTLRLRYEDDHDVYYYTIPKVDYANDFSIVSQLKAHLPHLKAIIIGSDQEKGDSILVMDETLLVPLLREFLLMLEKFA